MRHLIEKVIRNCIKCILAEWKHGKQDGWLHNIDKGELSLDTYHTDHLGPIPSTKKSYRYRYRELDLKIQPDKCEFLKPELEYLGHVVTAEGIKPNPAKIEAVKKFKPPTTPIQVKSFLGLAGYYRKFVRNFSKISRPLIELTKKDTKFHWTDAHTNSFETLNLLTAFDVYTRQTESLLQCGRRVYT